MYKIVYSKRALKDIEKIKINGLADKTKSLIEIIKLNPFTTPPHYEKLLGKLRGTYSRRINVQHRLVYQVYEQEKTIKIISLWTHYE